MTLTKITPSIIGANCYVLTSENQAVVIDPSISDEQIAKICENVGAEIVAILLTHAHFDHMLGLERLKARFPDVPVMIHANDAELMSDGEKNAYTVFFNKPRSFGQPDKLLVGGDVIRFGADRLTVIHTPGHTKGSVCYRSGNILFSGDTIMTNSYGRCDLYSGDTRKMNESLNSLYSFAVKNPGVVIYPGHGEKNLLIDALSEIFDS